MMPERITESLIVVCGILVGGLLFTAGVGAQSISEDILDRFHYREIGPSRPGGRVVSFSVSQQDAYTFFVGAGPGGVWKTENNGQSYTPVFDDEGTSAIGYVAVAPSDDSIVWVGTGESNLRNSTYYGDGAYKSTDGGATWTNMGLRASHHIGTVLIHPTNPDVVYVAAQGYYYSENSERGVYKTTDGGETWVKSLAISVDGRDIGATDMVMDPRDPAVIYATTYDRLRRPWGFRSAGVGSGIYKTTNGGDSWTKLGGGLPTGFLGKIGVAVYAQNPRIVYAIVEDANASGVTATERWDELERGQPSAGKVVGNITYRSDDGGGTWRQVSDGVVGDRGNYYARIFVDPNDSEHVFVMGTRVNESTDGGKTYRKAFRYGGDNHVIWIDPSDSRHMLLGYDYGMAITYDAGANWYHPDELGMAQIYAIGVDMDYPYNVYGGLQDFGSWKGPSTKKGRFPIRFEDWEHVKGGDGFYNLVDPTNSRWLYSTSQFGDLARIDQKTGVRRSISMEGRRNYRFNWNAPLVISPHNPNVLYQGAQKVLRSDFRGNSWEEVSEDLTTNDAARFGGVEVRQYCTITALDESPVKAGVLWAGTDDGNVQVTRDGGETWTLLNDNIPDNPQYWVTRIVASHHDAGTAYLTYTGRHHTDFTPYVYKTTDYGETWASIAGNLPEEAVNVIREDRKNPNLLFVGTDRTVYVTLNGGDDWSELKNNLPTIPVKDLLIHPRENDLVLGTMGRGFWITDISPLQGMTAAVLKKKAHLFAIEPRVQWVMPRQPATSAQNFAGENEPKGAMVNYYLKREIQGGAQIEVYDGSVLINVLDGPGEAGLNSVQWYMTKRSARGEGGRRWRFEEDEGGDDDEEEEEEEEEDEGNYEQEEGGGNDSVAEDDEEDFYDYYDTVDFHLNADDEVDAWGQSQRTRAGGRGPYSREWRYQRVQPGRYTVKLIVGGETLTETADILQDYWYDK